MSSHDGERLRGAKRAEEAMPKKGLFGEIAIKKGFVTEEQVKMALEVQKEMDAIGEKHKLIGVIMLELGMLTSEQILEILKTFEKDVGEK